MDDRALIRQALQASPPFVAESKLRMLSDADVDDIIDAMATQTLSSKGEVLCREGTKADACYVVRTGFLHIAGNSRWGAGSSSGSGGGTAVAGPGDLVGESEFFAGELPRPVTVQAAAGVGATVFVLTIADYRRIVAREDGMERRGDELKQMGLFKVRARRVTFGWVTTGVHHIRPSLPSTSRASRTDSFVCCSVKSPSRT